MHGHWDPGERELLGWIKRPGQQLEATDFFWKYSNVANARLILDRVQVLGERDGGCWGEEETVGC